MRFYLLLTGICGFLLCSVPAQSQGTNSTELGVAVGVANILSDLGGTIFRGRGFVTDLKFAATRPSAGAYFRINFNKYVGIRFNGLFAQVYGDDAMIELDPSNPTPGAEGWFRRYRNLSFRSHIIEFSGIVEINLLPYVGGSLRERFAPYVFIGIGGFHFDPQTEHNGEWIQLQPLGTEGQGLPQYPEKEKYSRIALAVPFGAGVRYNISKRYSIGIEFSHRMTNTDYIDDVSTTYVDPAFYYANYSPDEAALVSALADRTSGEYPMVTAPGQQRGDPSDNDTYSLLGMVNISYVFSRHGRSTNEGLFCPKLF